MKKAIEFAHDVLINKISTQDIFVDMTMGNGNDTLFLCKIAKFVYAFDIQQIALDNTKKKLIDNDLNNYSLILDTHENIDYYTISGYACKLCDSSTPNYEKMQARLEEMYVFGTFPYDHIVIDEGQDFGIEDVEEAAVIETLKSIIEDTKNDTSSFYIFYDKLQLVHSSRVPKYIEAADCKLTLYRNCRKQTVLQEL